MSKRGDRVLFRFGRVSLIVPCFEFWLLFTVEGPENWYWLSLGRDWKVEFLRDRRG